MTVNVLKSNLDNVILEKIDSLSNPKSVNDMVLKVEQIVSEIYFEVYVEVGKANKSLIKIVKRIIKKIKSL